MNSILKTPAGRYAVSFVITTVVSIAVIAAVSIIFSFFPPGEKLLSLLGRYIYILPAFVSAFISGRKAKSRGFLTGIISACLYILILVIAGGLIFKSRISPATLPGIFIPVALSGALGGILGINFK